jgi:hypothetical protein
MNFFRKLFGFCKIRRVGLRPDEISIVSKGNGSGNWIIDVSLLELVVTLVSPVAFPVKEEGEAIFFGAFLRLEKRHLLGIFVPEF